VITEDRTDSGWTPAADRYATTDYRRAGRSGLLLPPISLGLWQNFGADRPLATPRAILRRAFDLGVTHIDLANNYGPPYGAAETTFGQVMASDLRPYRDELLISSKAGYDMWPGPYGDAGLDYVDVFYSHRRDVDTPLEETMGALDAIVRSGKALYVGISNYSPEDTARSAELLADLGTPLTLHQPRYSIFDRSPEGGVLEAAATAGAGVAVFSPLAQGRLTDRYLNGVPEGSRATRSAYLSADDVTDDLTARARALNEVAAGRGQTLAQLALRWVLRDERVTTAIIGASSVAQLEANLQALAGPDLTADEIAAIEPHAAAAGSSL
jgi:L-glyceraldehyde 3-phosphate reductase